MDESTLKRAERVYFEVSHLHANARRAALDAACAGDAALRAEVESLLQHSAGAREFLEEPALGTDFRLLTGVDAGPDTMAGRTIGSFRVDERLASGGMGTVYLASRADADFDQQVAIKIVKRGMDTEEIIRRFRAERRTLAALDHPNIARLIDGGVTPEGQPYLVMEYVPGMAIDDYCDSQSLDTHARLKLFKKVCDAVQYAHQNLVVHRDLKPGNILVTPAGVPKLLDFGIAKLLTESSPADMTMMEERRLTPEYASPEQIAGVGVTTSSDVYSLGVILYELLTGCRPYVLKSRTTAEMERVICEVEPPAPSTAVMRPQTRVGPGGKPETAATPEAVSSVREGSPQRLRRRLRGDLDNIVMMALRKDPARRYASVEQFASDIHRYLCDLPVIARAETPAYVLGKFIKRHAWGTAAFSVAVGLLIAGLVFIRAQRDEAYAARDQAERIADFMQQVLGAADSGDTRAMGTSASIPDVLAAAAARAQVDLAESPRVLAAVRSVLGRAYLGLGMYDKAEEHIRAGLTLREDILPRGHHDIAESKLDLAHLHYARGELKEAEGLLRESLAVHQHQRGEKNQDTARVWNDLGAVLRAAGKIDEAEVACRTALEIRRAIADSRDTIEIAESLNNLAGVQRQKGNTAAAIVSLEESARIRKKLLPHDHPLVVQSIANLAILKAGAGDLAGGIELMREALPMEARSLGLEHPDYARSLSSYGVMLMRIGRLDQAEEPIREALRIRRLRLEPGDPGLLAGVDAMARVLIKLHRDAEAEPLLREALELAPRGTERAQTYRASITAELKALYARTGETAKAERLAGEGAAPAADERNAVPPSDGNP